MKLSSLVNEELIKFHSKVSSKKEAIQCILDELSKSHVQMERIPSITKAIEERELLGGTIFPSGIAIPHARLTDFNDLTIGICIPEVPFVEENTTIKMVVLLLTGKTSSNLYLQTLAAFMRISQNGDLFSKITAVQNKTEIIKAFSDILVKKEIAVSDIMTKDIISLKGETTIKEVADIFAKNNLSYAPVLDGAGKLIGEITMTELLRIGIPNYAMLIGNLKFLNSFEPFEDFLRNEDKIQVKDIMLKQNVMLKEETSVVEAALELVKNHRRHLPVIKDGLLTGVVSSMDILYKVIRG